MFQFEFPILSPPPKPLSNLKGVQTPPLHLQMPILDTPLSRLHCFNTRKTI